MTRPNLATIMRRAHQIAQECEGDYRARLALGMRAAWAEAKGATARPNDYWKAAQARGEFDILFAIDSVRLSARYNLGKSEEEFMRMAVGRSVWAGANESERDWLRGKMFQGSGYGIGGGRVVRNIEIWDNA